MPRAIGPSSHKHGLETSECLILTFREIRFVVKRKLGLYYYDEFELI